jgi:transposase
MVKKTKSNNRKKPNSDNRKPRQSRTPSQMERDNLLISSMYLKGISQSEIAEKTGIDQATVSRTLKALQSEWQTRAILNVDERKRMELERIDLVEREAWQAWEKSKGKKSEQFTRSKGRPSKLDPTKMEMQPQIDVQNKQWEADGDAKYLTIVMQCVERRCKILGIDAPIKTADYQLTAQTPKPILRRIAAGVPVDIAHIEYALGLNKDQYGE